MALSAHSLPPSPVRRRRRVPKYRPLTEIYESCPKSAVVNNGDVAHIICVNCDSGDKENELLLCDKCDKAYHMCCLSPIVVRVPIGHWYCPTCTDLPPRSRSLSHSKIYDFFRIKKCYASSLKRISPQDSRKRKKRTGPLVYHKRNRKLLPYVPSDDPSCRLNQMKSLASALRSLNLEFSDDLTYPPGMAPESANQAILEHGGMQVLSKEDTITLEKCRAMAKRGECPPLLVVFDHNEGYTIEADGPIKDLTLIAEYAGDVDYIKNRENDDCDSMMTLLLATDPTKSLVICPDKHGNIARFFNGINNYVDYSRTKLNIKCVRYNVGGQCRVLLVATRDIKKGERLYYDYNGYEHEYPTYLFS